MRVYISGPITHDKNYKKKFEYAEALLKIYGIEEVFNPAKVNLPDNTTWEEYMKHDLNELLKCDGIYMLKGWRRSKGARLEYKIAKALGLKIAYKS